MLTIQPAQPVAAAPWVTTAESAPPELRARAAILVDDASGAVLFQRNARERLPIASLTKMMTALVALEHASPDFIVQATERSLTEPAVIGLAPGDRLRLEDLLYGLILASGNDAALAIAESVGGGDGAAAIERFVGWMNERAAALGLEETHFANPHGFDDPQNYSTAADVAKIARLYLRHPLLARIAATERYEVSGEPRWVFHNINRFLVSYEGADGIKTGYESLAGRCLAASATRAGQRLIAVVLNSDDYVGDAAALLDYGFERQRSVLGEWLLLPVGAWSAWLDGSQIVMR
jgi:D-alanyl-D-alanine carboxypeptidase